MTMFGFFSPETPLLWQVFSKTISSGSEVVLATFPNIVDWIPKTGNLKTSILPHYS